MKALELKLDITFLCNKCAKGHHTKLFPYSSLGEEAGLQSLVEDYEDVDLAANCKLKMIIESLQLVRQVA